MYTQSNRHFFFFRVAWRGGDVFLAAETQKNIGGNGGAVFMPDQRRLVLFQLINFYPSDLAKN